MLDAFAWFETSDIDDVAPALADYARWTARLPQRLDVDAVRHDLVRPGEVRGHCFARRLRDGDALRDSRHQRREQRPRPPIEPVTALAVDVKGGDDRRTRRPHREPRRHR